MSYYDPERWGWEEEPGEEIDPLAAFLLGVIVGGVGVMLHLFFLGMS